MITQTIYIRKYDWTVHCYYAVDCYYTQDIIDHLAQIGCPPVELYKAKENMSSRRMNQGLTYSNPSLRETVMVTSITSSPAEFFDSLLHELDHVKEHIKEAWGIPSGSEEQSYLIGDLSRAVFPHIKHLLCTHCRTKSYRGLRIPK